MADFRSILIVILVAPLAHAQVGPTPDWIDEPTPTTPTTSTPTSSTMTMVAADRPPALVIESIEANKKQIAPAIEALPLGTTAPRTEGTAVAPAETGPGSLTDMILPLAVVLGLIVALAAGARAFMRSKGGLVASLGAGGRAPSGVLEVLGRYPVARGSTLVLLKLDRRVLLVAQTKTGKLGGGAFTTLTEITDPEEVASVLLKTRTETDDSISKRFTTMLGAFERQQPPIEHVAVTAPRTPESHGAIASVRQRLADMRSSEVAG